MQVHWQQILSAFAVTEMPLSFKGYFYLVQTLKLRGVGRGKGYITKFPSHEFSIKDYACLVIIANLKLVKLSYKYE